MQALVAVCKMPPMTRFAIAFDIHVLHAQCHTCPGATSMTRMSNPYEWIHVHTNTHYLFQKAMASVPPDVVKQVNDLVQNEDLPVLKKVDQILQLLQHKGLCYKTAVLPKETLTHPSNKGGSLLNPQDVWSKGLRMLNIGIQPGFLQEGGVAFELSTEAGKRNQQLSAKTSLVESADGFLAAVTGNERYLTVATSHAAAFCKAVEACCKSPVTGQPLEMKADEGLLKLINSGWPMNVISEHVEVQVPSLPAWLQLAMNSVNMGLKQVNEIEAAALMSELLQHGKTLQEAQVVVEQSDPVCKPRLPAISYYVSRYGGGDSQGLLKFLSQFSA